jgi:hypothetical protein
LCTVDTDEQYMSISKIFDAVVDVTGMIPQPMIGWYFDGRQLLDHAGNVPQSMLITKLGMLRRFTVPERLAILDYVEKNPVSIPAILLQNVQAATFVDLKRSDTIAGVSELIGLNLISADRAAAILNTAPDETEAYRG